MGIYIHIHTSIVEKGALVVVPISGAAVVSNADNKGQTDRVSAD